MRINRISRDSFLFRFLSIFLLAALLLSVSSCSRNDEQTGTQTDSAIKIPVASDANGEAAADVDENAQRGQSGEATGSSLSEWAAGVFGGLFGENQGDAAQGDGDEEEGADPSESPIVNIGHTPDALTSRTIMIYIVGSDLESEHGLASMNIQQIMDAGVDLEWNNVLIQTGGANSWDLEIPSDMNVILNLTETGLQFVHMNSAKNMASPQTLTDFLAFCYEFYKSDTYSLILWNHGGGPMLGFGHDEIADDILSLPDLSSALLDSPFGIENKLEIVGFDACLMSSIETAYIFKDYARYFIAAQEVIPGWGWDYTFLGDIEPSMDALDVSRLIIDSYYELCELIFMVNPMLECDITLSCMDLSRIGGVEEGLNALYSRVGGYLDSESFPPVARARSNAKEFGRFGTEALLDLVDIEHLSSLMSADYPAEARRLSDALNYFVIYNRSNVSNANGVSMYYPYSNREHASEQAQLYQAFGFADGYTGYMEKFIAFLEDLPMAEWDLRRALSGQIRSLPGSEDAVRVFIELTEEQVQNYSGATYQVLRKEGDSYKIIYSSSDVELDPDGMLYANYAGRMQMVQFTGSGDTHHIVMFEKERTDAYIRYHVPIYLANDGDGDTDWRLVWLQLQTDTDGQNARMLSVVPIEEDGSSLAARQLINIYDYDKVMFMDLGSSSPTLDDNDNLLPYFDWDLGIWASNEWGQVWLDKEMQDDFRFVQLDIDQSTEYCVIFNVSDVQGNEHTSWLIPINFNEDGISYFIQRGTGEIDLRNSGITNERLAEMVQSGEIPANIGSLQLDGNDISDISPLGTLRGLLFLDLNNTQVSDLTPLSSLTNLSALRINNNDISDLTTLSSLTSLRSLYMNNNRVSDLSPLGSLVGLDTLEMSNNEISDLTPLHTLTALRRLHLNNNRIDDLTPLHTLTGIHTLRLEDNQIGNLSGLQSLTVLTSLQLNNNRISDLTPLHSLEDLRELQLEDNRIGDLSGLQSLTELTTLQLHNNRISDLTPLQPLTGLRHLRLEDNLIGDIEALRSMTELSNLNLSNNMVSDISALHPLTELSWLSLENNQIGSIEPLRALVNLEYLSLQDNLISGDISALQPLAKLRSLRLENNRISKIPPLNGLVSLETLNLDNNQISDVSGLSALTALKDLHLDNNRISNIAPLRQLSSVETLYLGSNQIRDLSGLRSMAQLRSLFLDNNRITDITPLRSLSNLWLLVLRNNQIRDVTPLQALPSLRLLALESNRISDVSQFQPMVKLSNLRLNDNQITDVSPLLSLTGLERLSLVSNRIRDATPLRSMTHLSYLNLAGNSLTEMQMNDLADALPDCEIHYDEE